MKDYEVVYIDKNGSKQTFVVSAIDTNTAIANTLEIRSDCRRVTRCTPTKYKDNEVNKTES
jgi:hypothetical protein